MMKAFVCLVVWVAWVGAGHAQPPVSGDLAAPRALLRVGPEQQRPAPPPAAEPLAIAALKPAPPAVDEYGDIEVAEKAGDDAKAEIADPLEPFNRAMYHFNDRLYFWVLKPVAEGYGKVVPEPARVGVRNFFSNLTFPVRFVNCLLQANVSGAAEELGRFLVNTLFGVGGLMDPAAGEEINLVKQEEDLGQTLGSYGLGQGFFINWPLFGPSSPRDTLGRLGDGFLTPTSYLTPWYAGAGARGVDLINDTSLSIGEYESLKGAAIDPYLAIRNAYVQYRQKKVNQKGSGAAAGDRSGTNP